MIAAARPPRYDLSTVSAPALSFRELARAAVLRTNGYWPFSWTNRAIYHGVVRLFLRLCEGPEVAAVYLRNSMASGEFTPGSSDIDLALVLRAGLDPEREFAFLHSFWNRFARLRARLPMLGEVDVFDESQCAEWLRHSAQSPDPPVWKLLLGTDVRKREPSLASPRWPVRALKTAFWFYIDGFLPRLGRTASFAELQILQRMARKIHRLSALAARSGPPSASEWLVNREDLPGRVVCALDRAASAIESVSEPHRFGPGDVGPSLPVRGDAVSSVLHGYTGRSYVIFREGIEAGAIAQSLAANGHIWRGLHPAYITPALFRFLVHHYSPQQFRHFELSRAISWGGDPLPGCRPPRYEECRAALLDQIPNAFMSARREELFTGLPPAGTLEGNLRQLLPVLLVQSGELTAEAAADPHPLCRVRFAAEYDEVRRLSSSWEAYLFFRRISHRIQEGIEGGRRIEPVRQPS